MRNGQILARTRDHSRIETLIAQSQPCSGVRNDDFIPVHIDDFESVRLDGIQISVQGDAVAVSLAGRLSCKTSDAAVFPGNAAATIAANANGSLADCAISQAHVDLSDFGGKYGPILQAFEGPIETLLTDTLRKELGLACTRFKAGVVGQ